MSALFLSPIATPYGGSVNTRSAIAPPINFFTYSASALSPHIRTWLPSFHKSPALTTCTISSSSSEKSSSSTDAVLSDAPVSPSSIPSHATFAPHSESGRSSHALASASMSHSPKEPLSLMTISFSFSTGKDSGSTMHGISFHPRALTASMRIFPPRTMYFPSLGYTIAPRASRSSGVSLILFLRLSISSFVHWRGLDGRPSIWPVFISKSFILIGCTSILNRLCTKLRKASRVAKP